MHWIDYEFPTKNKKIHLKIKLSSIKILVAICAKYKKHQEFAELNYEFSSKKKSIQIRIVQI